ncbi:MAG: transposase, partial [Gemmatimonadota bacterium]
MLATRRRGVVVPAGQGLLFSNVETPPPAIAEAAASADAEADDGSSDAGRTTTAAAGKKGTPRTPRKLYHGGLPREDRVHAVAEAERVDPVTGKPLRKIGESVFEELDSQRARSRVIRHVRPIQGPSAADGKLRDVPPVMADLPPRPLEGCAASAGLLSWLLVQKFAKHLPLHRQEAIFGRDGMRLIKQALCDWTLASGEALRPIIDRLQQSVCSGPVLQLDDTPVMCQAGRGESNFRAYLWTFVNPQVDAVVHRFPAGRGSRLLADALAGLAGTIVGDGY